MLYMIFVMGWYTFIWFWEIWKIYLAIFGSSSIIFCIFDPGISTLIFQRTHLLQREILEARFWAPNSNFSFSSFRTSGRNFERSTRISKKKLHFCLQFFNSIWYFDPGILIVIFKTLISLQQEILEACFWASNSYFWFWFLQTSGRNFERPAGMSSIRPECRTFGWNLERSSGISNIRPEFRTFAPPHLRGPFAKWPCYLDIR